MWKANWAFGPKPKDNFVLTDFQSGVLPGRSTVTQLIGVCHMFCSSVDNEKEVSCIFRYRKSI